jgi:hypothetical protein
VLLNARGKLLGSRSLFDDNGAVIGLQEVTEFKSDTHWQHAELHFNEAIRLMEGTNDDAAHSEFSNAANMFEKAAALLPTTATVLRIAASGKPSSS